MRPSSPWRRHWRLAVGFPLVMALLVIAFGPSRVRALSSSDRLQRDAPVTDVGAEVGDLFDPTEVHAITLRWRDADYRRMLDDFFETGDTEFVEADLTIDGLEVASVGVRLNGHASLLTLRDLSSDLSIERPEGLPWLLSFDEFVADRRFQGNEEVVLRPAGDLTPATVGNEALSLAVIDDAGDAAPAFAWSTFAVNGRPAALRLVVQHPGEAMTDDDFADDGPLYKARPTGRFRYRGEDPLAYADDVTQLTNRKQQDLQPFIDFVRWVTTAGDDEFEAGLADRLDVASFARYLALQHLLRNDDDMAGAGQNYLLFFDVTTDRFTVATWDMNVALNGDVARGPLDVPVDPLGGHALKERFLATAAFRPLYLRTYRELYQRYFADGRAAELLDGLAAALDTVDPAVATRAALRADVAQLRSFLAGRTRGLAGHADLAG